MADEYISKQAFNDAIREAVRKYPNTFYNGLEVARQIAHDMDAADVVPVRHGRWIETTQPMGWDDVTCAECSECGEDFVLDEWGMDDMKNLMLYCPNCGAKMDKEGDT